MGVIASVSGLAQGYGGKRVISDLDLEVGPGILGLLGPNGAGKTTLLRTLATVAPPQAGTLSILDEAVDSEQTAMRMRRSIGYLPQDFGFYPAFSVYDFVRYCAWARGVPGRDAHEATMRAIEAVDLLSRAKEKMKRLSGGMLRRAGIACAIVGSPQLLLLDEPTVGLDPAQRLEFRQLLRSLRGAAIVLSTHLVEDIGAVCDEVAVLDEGRIVFKDHPQALSGAASADSVGDTPLERGYMTILQRQRRDI